MQPGNKNKNQTVYQPPTCSQPTPIKNQTVYQPPHTASQHQQKIRLSTNQPTAAQHAANQQANYAHTASQHKSKTRLSTNHHMQPASTTKKSDCLPTTAYSQPTPIKNQTVYQPTNSSSTSSQPTSQLCSYSHPRVVVVLQYPWQTPSLARGGSSTTLPLADILTSQGW